MKIQSKIFYSYISLVIIYVLLTFLPEPAKATLTRYHVQPDVLRLLYITLVLPILLLWFAIFYGYAQLRRYGKLIKDNRDGIPVAKLSTGLFVFAFGMPISSILASTLKLIANAHPGFSGASTIISNYFQVAYLVVAFLFVSLAARGLSALSRSRPSLGVVNVVVLVSIVLGVVYCALIASAHHNIVTNYHMSYIWVMLTFGIPYIYIWFLGLYAIAEMYAYSKHVSGVVYRKAWDRLTFGIGAVIVTNISIQYLSTLVTWLNSLTLDRVLLLLYVLLLLFAGSFIVVALGAKQLMKIEEV